MTSWPVCTRCADSGYVCENHPHLPWAELSSHETACGCGAGMPCPDCRERPTTTP